jgi:hypothetical protein
VPVVVSGAVAGQDERDSYDHGAARNPNAGIAVGVGVLPLVTGHLTGCIRLVALARLLQLCARHVHVISRSAHQA